MLEETRIVERLPTHRTILTSFLKIGSIGFGGGMAIIALMEEEFVRRLSVITSEEFLSGVGLSQILGAFPVNTAVFIGYRLCGLSGALLAVTAFLLPSITLVIILSDIYFRFHSIPALQSMVLGVGPAVIALLLNASWSLGRAVLQSRLSMLVALVALIATFFQISPVWIILAAAIIGYTLMTSDANALKLPAQPRTRDGSDQKRSVLALAFGIPGKLTSLIAAFLKVGIAFFGGGFVIIPLLRAKLVMDLHWVTPQEFLDGLAISTLTPGPIAVIATFVGYHKAGIAGALVATISLLAPGIALTIWASEGYCRFRSSPALKRVLSGLPPATAGLILGAAILLGKHSVSGWRGALLVVVALLLLRRFRWHPALVLALGGTGGYLGVIR